MHEPPARHPLMDIHSRNIDKQITEGLSGQAGIRIVVSAVLADMMETAVRFKKPLKGRCCLVSVWRKASRWCSGWESRSCKRGRRNVPRRRLRPECTSAAWECFFAATALCICCHNHLYSLIGIVSQFFVHGVFQKGLRAVFISSMQRLRCCNI